MKTGVFGHSRFLAAFVHGLFAHVFIVGRVKSRFPEVAVADLLLIVGVCESSVSSSPSRRAQKKNIPRSDKTIIEAEEGWHSGVQVFI